MANEADDEPVDEIAREMAQTALAAWASLVAVIAFDYRDYGATERAHWFLDRIDDALGATILSAEGYDMLRDRLDVLRQALDKKT